MIILIIINHMLFGIPYCHEFCVITWNKRSKSLEPGFTYTEFVTLCN